MIIGVIADTHGCLDPTVLEHFADCDEVWHAGDFGSTVANELRQFKPLRGVYGNIDNNVVRAEFPENQIFKCEQIPVLMTHIAGRLGTYDGRVRQLMAQHQPQILVCGHSHIPRVERDTKFQVVHLNPWRCRSSGFSHDAHDCATRVETGEYHRRGNHSTWPARPALANQSGLCCLRNHAANGMSSLSSAPFSCETRCGEGHFSS